MTKTVKACALLLPELRQLLSTQDHATLKQVLREINPVDLAEGWKDFSRLEQLTLFQLLGLRKAVVVFEELDVEDQVFLLHALGDQATGQMVSELDPAVVAHLFRKLPRRVIRRLTHLVKQQEAAEGLEQVLHYPPRTAGALMHTGVIRLKESMTATQALQQIRAVARSRTHEPNLLTVLYVVNGQGRLVGYVSLQALVAAPQDAQVLELMGSTQAIRIPASADQEEAARLVSKYNLVSAPVVDESDQLVGALLVDDVLEILSQEATEDITRLAGAGPAALVSRSFLRATRLRLPWLMITFAGQLLVAWMISRFEATLNRWIAMVSFMPLIAALGGNIGSQSATLIVRGLATGELKEPALIPQVVREMLTGLVCGLLYGVALGGIAFLAYGTRFHAAFALSVGLAVLVSMTVSATLGATVPMLFRRVGVDPALASTPLISTTTDFLSVAAYFLLAATLLRGELP